MKNIEQVPEGWYEKNRIAVIPFGNSTYVYRLENRGGGEFGLVSYHVNINGVDTIVPETFFYSLEENGVIYLLQYKYIDENYETYSIYDLGATIFSERD